MTAQIAVLTDTETSNKHLVTVQLVAALNRLRPTEIAMPTICHIDA